MAENYKHLYEQMKLIVEKYQDEIVPELRKLLAERVKVVRCKDCLYSTDSFAKVNEKGFLICPASGMEITDEDFCSYGERRGENE